MGEWGYLSRRLENGELQENAEQDIVTCFQGKVKGKGILIENNGCRSDGIFENGVLHGWAMKVCLVPLTES